MTDSLFDMPPEPGTYKGPTASSNGIMRNWAEAATAAAIAEGQQLAREGTETALGAAPAAFPVIAMAALIQAARANPELTSDDVVPLCSMTAPEPRAWGAVFLQAARDGVIEATDRTRKTTHRAAHARDKRVWRSLVYRG